MTCKEFEKIIPEYMQKKLDFMTEKQFVEHLHVCPTCMEELNIQFLVEEGLVRLEDGRAFDLQKEIKEFLKDSDKKVRVHEKAVKTGKIVEIIIMLGVLAAVFALVIL
jgi:hypothetical protein